MSDPFKVLCDKITNIQSQYGNPTQRDSAKKEAISLWKQLNPGKNRPPEDNSPHGMLMSKLDDSSAIVASMLTPEQCKKYNIFG